jgi:CheY-like chemotaxis protein
LSKQLVILSVGRDPNLLRSRNQVLESSGSMVVSARSASEALEKFRDEAFDLVLICHTLPTEEQNAIRRRIHAKSHSTRVLTVVPAYEGDDPNVDTVPNTPEALIAAVAEMAKKKLVRGVGNSFLHSRRHA